MINQITSKYYWYKFADQVKDFVGKCRVCQDSKSKGSISKHTAKFVYWKPTKINQVVAIDFTKPSPESSPDGKNKVLTIIDLYDGWVTYVPTKGETTDDWVLAMERYAWRNGPPTTILCDNGSSFTSMAGKILLVAQ